MDAIALRSDKKHLHCTLAQSAVLSSLPAHHKKHQGNIVWSNAYMGLAQPPLQTERARIEGFSPLILAFVFLSVDM